MSERRTRRLDDLHRRVLRLANASWSDLHPRLSEVIFAADGIVPTEPLRDEKGRFLPSGAGTRGKR